MLRPVEQMTHIQTIEDDSATFQFSQRQMASIERKISGDTMYINAQNHELMIPIEKIGPGQNGINCQPVN